MAPDPTDPAAALRARLAQLRAEIAEREEEAERVERALAALTGELFNGKCSDMSNMIPETRVRHSQGKSRTMAAAGKPVSRVVAIANAAGFSLHSLGEQPGVSCTASMLSQAASGTAGMSHERAEAIQQITVSEKYPKGIEATKRFWPLLRPKKTDS